MSSPASRSARRSGRHWRTVASRARGFPRTPSSAGVDRVRAAPEPRGARDPITRALRRLCVTPGLLAAAAERVAEALSAATLEAGQIGGETRFLPHRLAWQALICNAQTLTEPPATGDELLAVAQARSGDRQGRGLARDAHRLSARPGCPRADRPHAARCGAPRRRPGVDRDAPRPESARSAHARRGDGSARHRRLPHFRPPHVLMGIQGFPVVTSSAHHRRADRADPAMANAAALLLAGVPSPLRQPRDSPSRTAAERRGERRPPPRRFPFSPPRAKRPGEGGEVRRWPCWPSGPCGSSRAKR